MTSKQLNDRAGPLCARRVRSVPRKSEERIAYRWKSALQADRNHRAFSFSASISRKVSCGKALRSIVTAVHVHACVCARMSCNRSDDSLLSIIYVRACWLITRWMRRLLREVEGNVTFSNYSSCAVLEVSFLQGDRFSLGLINLASWRPI